MKFNEKVKEIIKEVIKESYPRYIEKYKFTINTLVDIDKKIKKLKLNDISDFSAKYGIDLDGQTTKIFSDRIEYLSEGKNIEAYFDIEYIWDGDDETDDEDRYAGIILSFDIKTGKLTNVDFGGGGSWFH